MLRKLSLTLSLLAATLLIALLAVPSLSPVSAQVAADQLAKPPADAKIWTITSSGGAAEHGEVALWTAKDGTQWSRMDFHLRGFVSAFDEQNRFAKDGTLQSMVIRGSTPQGDAAETYDVKNGVYTFKTPVDSGTGKADPSTQYVSFGGTFDSFTFLIKAMLKAPDHSVNLLPSGKGSIAPLTTLEVSNGTDKKTITAYAITGFGFSPFPVWLDGDNFFGTAGVINFLPKGWEKAGEAMSKAQDEALAKLAPAQMAAIAKTPVGPVAITHVKLYDSEALVFRDDMTVVVDKGVITAVGPTATTKLSKSTDIITGAGKTLIPGLWDNHQHYGDDSTGPLLLASGITSVRDPGNQPDELMARKKRIDDGELLGQRIVPSMLIDGPGQYTAQVAVVVKSLDEALAAVQKAKDKGFFGIKLYGSLDPSYVKPMAALAHKLGLRVHGHIPHGMRPLEAVRAGYDEITHINFVMMQAMPDDVVKVSNTLARFTGTAKYAKDVDLHSPAMTAYLDELGKRHIAVDPTLVTLEDLSVPDRGTYPPADAPYVDTLPAQVSRGFLSSAMAESAELSRADMRASFAKLRALIPELYKRHVTILAGTDNIGFELIRELEIYVEAGLTPAEALATATSNPARAYGLWAKTGSLTKGKLAELALIDGDPSKDIGDLRQVELVMRDGKIMLTSDLRAPLGISGLPKKR